MCIYIYIYIYMYVCITVAILAQVLLPLFLGRPLCGPWVGRSLCKEGVFPSGLPCECLLVRRSAAGLGCLACLPASALTRWTARGLHLGSWISRDLCPSCPLPIVILALAHFFFATLSCAASRRFVPLPLHLVDAGIAAFVSGFDDARSRGPTTTSWGHTIAWCQ